MSASASSMQRRSNKRAFIIAALFGLVAAFLTFSYLKNANSGDKTTAVPMVPVVVALKDIPARTVIKENMLTVKEVPQDVRLNLALTDKSVAVGSLTRESISTGEQVLRNKVADQVRDVGFSANIPQGKRGVAVGVSEVIASGGHVGVGDFVDVVGIFEVYDPNFKNPICQNCQSTPRRYITTTILQNIQVLAVAEKSQPTIQKDAKSGETKSMASEQAKSVTLAVSPQQAAILLQSETMGELRLSLRPFGDAEVVELAPIFNDPGNWPTVKIGQ